MDENTIHALKMIQASEMRKLGFVERSLEKIKDRWEAERAAKAEHVVNIKSISRVLKMAGLQ